MRTRISQLATIALFMLCISLPILFSDKKGGQVSPLENRNLASFPSSTSNNYRKDFELWLKDNIFGRLFFRSANSSLNYRIFQIFPTENVVAGKEDWLFNNHNSQMQIGQGQYLYTLEQLEEIRLNQEAIMRTMNAEGRHYLLVLVPIKSSVYPEYMPAEFPAKAYTLADQLTDYLQENSDVPVLNLKPALLAGKAQEQVYLKDDTHWTQRGAYIGYRALIAKMNELGWTDVDPLPVSKGEVYERRGDLRYFIGPGLTLPPAYDYPVILPPTAAQRIESGPQYDELLALLEKLEQKNSWSQSIYNNPQGSSHSVIAFIDSFFYGYNIPELMAGTFSTYTTIRYRPTDAFIHNADADIVIIEVYEGEFMRLFEPLDYID